MNLDRLVGLGLDDDWRARIERAGVALASVGRVCAEHRDRWLVAIHDGDVEAMLAGRLRHEVESGSAPRPVVGDWVALRDGDEGASQRLVTRVVPRRTWIARKAPGRTTAAQTLAANVDVAFLVAALGAEVNERRIERFATILGEGGVRMVVVLGKVDLVDDVTLHLARASHAAPGAPVHAVSALTGAGIEALEPYLSAGATVAVLGLSGAGKSTLVNRWLGGEVQRTTEVRESDGKGRHTTTTRELIALPMGCLVLDTPGLREVGLTDTDDGLDDAFPDVAAVATRCKFGDCRHEGEPGCAVAAALAAGELAAERVEAWRFLDREQARLAARATSGGAKREASKRVRSMALRKHLVAKGKT
ncbi:MAG: ribosome small subunit-dependent GTPase A [Deltaproteobacteria bacterium]|nr:ribosome small subunit-dependent GTPase A [Deltaproteobacteria bacterium]